MADITMCKGTNENICVSCYRRTATPNEYSQSYFIDIPIIKEGKCDEYISNKGWQR